MTGVALFKVKPASSAGRLAYLPIGFFGAVMGLTGLSLAWALAHRLYAAPDWIGQVIAAVALVTFVVLSAGYLTKLVTAPEAVLAEYRHPVASSLFGTFIISLVLTPMVMAPAYAPIARTLWVSGAVAALIFAWLMVSRWMGGRQSVVDAAPAWLIPVVGILNVPLALPILGWSSCHSLMIIGLAIGLFFAVSTFTIIFSRLVFQPPLPAGLQPSVMILVAPFAVGFSAYVTTTGHVDLFAQGLYILMLFILAVAAGRLRHLVACCPFRISWWAISFPMAASAVAALHFAHAAPSLASDVIAVGLLAAASLVSAVLLVRTLAGIARGELRALST